MEIEKQSECFAIVVQKSQTNFNMDLCEVFIFADIPLKKLSHPILLNFLKTQMNVLNPIQRLEKVMWKNCTVFRWKK